VQGETRITAAKKEVFFSLKINFRSKIETFQIKSIIIAPVKFEQIFKLILFILFSS